MKLRNTGLLCFVIGFALITIVLALEVSELNGENIRDAKVITIGTGVIFVVTGVTFIALGCFSNRSFIFAIIAFASAPLLYLIGISLVYPFQVDDSYISLRYARNLASGYGLVFNPDGPKIEGYTNFLLVLIESVLFRFGFRDLWLVKLLMISCGLSTLVIIVWYGQRLLDSSNSNNVLYWLPTLAASLIATSSPLVLWTVSGMETVLFVLLLCSGVVGYLLFLHGHLLGQRVLIIDLMLVLAVLTRPEGLLFWGLTTAHTLLLGRNCPRLLTRERIIGIFGSLGFLTSYGLWKIAYFGQVLPATYFAKQSSWGFSTFVGGVIRLIGFLSVNNNFFLGILIVIGLISVITIRKRVKIGFWYTATICGAYLIYLISLGFHISMDDAYRFYVPLIPLLSIFLIEFSLLVRDSIIRNSSVWAIGCVLSLSILIPSRFIDLWHAWRIDMNWGILSYQLAARDEARGLEQGHIALAQWLRERASPNATVVLFDAGAIPYFSELRAIDTWSLTDPHLLMLRRSLHTATSETEREEILSKMRNYVLLQNPEYIVQDNLSLFDDPAVQARYRPSGYKFVYLSSYMCGRQRVCSYILEPWQRRDVR